MDILILGLAFLLLMGTSTGVSGVKTLTLVNSCANTVWPGITSFYGSPDLDTTGFELPTQVSRTFQLPTSWNGRIWGRTGCKLNESGYFECQTGDCRTGSVECNGTAGQPPATLLELAVTQFTGPDVYDVSLVDGFNLPVIVEGTGGSGPCPWTGCTTDLNRRCPGELRSNDGSACSSACLVFKSADYCCVPPYGSPSTCRQSPYSEAFKAACPKTYSNQFDDATASYSCSHGTDYTCTFCPASSADNLLQGKSISANQTLISFYGTFALGFFTPENSTKYFLGIWYTNTVPSNTGIVWVANRNSPLDSPGVFMLGNDGNLVVLDEDRKVVVWSSNVSVSEANSTIGLLMDTGNLVLQSGNDILWESFDHPSDTMLPGMKISLNKRTGQQRRLTSWAAPDDPRSGKFTLGVDPKTVAQFFTWKENIPYVRSTLYIGKEANTTLTVDAKNRSSTNATAYSLRYDVDSDEAYFTYDDSNSKVNTRFKLNPNGQVELLLWMGKWFSWWKQLVDNCDLYAHCGPNGYCRRNGTLSLSSSCKCLTGFTPKFPKEWAIGNWSNGCIREKTLKCDNQTEGYFEKFEKLKLPDQSVLLDNTSTLECKSECNRDCSCTAYAYVDSTSSSAGKCLIWFNDLMDVVENQTLGSDIYVRLQGSPFTAEGSHGGSLKRSLTIGLSLGIAGLITIIFLLKKIWINRRKFGGTMKYNIAGGGQNDIELPLFSIKSILAATNNFSEANKLGEGGFGPVYKGILNVQEVAMKRLSKKSGQGHQEFMNELKLIAKLQHNNLVRLLGCCVEDDEQILVYEYMPNRSLDKFLFDPSESTKLDWNRRFQIIDGIAQGILYIHKYSRLKIIHRDLKASNVLLDGALKPKISDFGMAKIFEINQTEAETNRVVGTYGYMSPEYARYGQFSEKSDVFSFGVLMLEIISGKKNASFYHYEHSLTLAGWAWKLWEEGREMEIIDASIKETCQPHEALRCIHVGFLCVQEAPAHRPTMSSVIQMLQANEGISLPPPKGLAFSTLQNSPNIGSSSRSPPIFSVNSLTISTLDGR